jgi:putative acetyltransferase
VAISPTCAISGKSRGKALPAGLRLRFATPGDAPFIQRVHEESIRGAPGNHYSRAELESWAAGLKSERYVWAMNHGGETYLVADIVNGGGALAGFCSYGGTQIYGLYIHPDWMGRGLASEMLDHAERALFATGTRHIHIGASLIARPLYERHGYAIVRRRGWETRGGLVMDAFDMEKKIAFSPRPTI